MDSVKIHIVMIKGKLSSVINKKTFVLLQIFLGTTLYETIKANVN